MNIAHPHDRDGFISDVKWLNKRQFIFTMYLKSKTVDNEFEPLGQYLGDVFTNTSDRVVIDRIVDTLPNEPRVIMDTSWRHGYAKVCRSPLNAEYLTGDYQCGIKTKGKNPYIITDNQHRVRISFSTEDDDSQHFWYRNLETEKWEELGVYNRYKGKVNPLGFSKDGKNILVFVSDGSVPQGIYWLDPKTKEKELIHRIKGGFYIKDWIMDNDYYNPTIIGYSYEAERKKSVYFDPNSKEAKLQKSLEDVFPGEVVLILDYTQDSKTALVQTYSEKNPGSLFLMDLTTNKIGFIFDFKPQIKSKEMFATKPIKLKSRDGLMLHGYLTLPKSDQKKSGKLPLIVKVHGGPFGERDSWEFDPENQLFASKGYTVLQINYRGSSGYGAGFEYDAYNQQGAQMQDDLTDATLWAIKEGIADKDKICIYGFSYGGYAALMGAVKEPDLYKCAAPSAGIYDIELMHRFGDIQRSDQGEKLLKQRWGNSEEFFQQRSPIHHLDKLKAALFIMHGKKDERADFGQYKALTKKLKKMNYPFESMVFDREGHSLYALENQKKYYKKLFEFLDKHIGE